MYGKIVKMFCWFLFVLVILFTACLFAGCRTTMVPDITERTKEYRELEAEIRDGETELAVTGTKLESTSEQITESVNSIGQTGKQLEQSISESAGNEQEITDLLQRIRTRKIPNDIAIELREKYPALFIE